MGIVLMGYRGSGKTTVGRKLADRLWQPFIDVDDLIVQQAGKSIAEIFQDHGEEHFRRIESQMVKQAAAMPDHVIALGGGAILRPQNQQALKAAGHKLIYLRCEPKVLLERITADPQTAAARPNLTPLGGTLREIEKVLAEREPVYRMCMDAELDVTHLTPDEAVVYIVRLL